MKSSEIKKKMIYIVLGSSCMVANAHAQSSVSLYGVIDEGIDYVSNSGGNSLWRMRDGTYDGIYGSRWGLKGKEDLGGGLSAIFQLESGFSTENGQMRQGGLLFGRQAFVGLSDARWGALTLGRQYDSIVDYLQPLTAPGQLGGPLVHAGDIDNTDNTFRANNSIKYASPKMGGLSFGGLYAFTNSTAAGRGKTGLWSAGANYTFGPFTIAGAYLYAKDPALLLTDGNYVSNTTGAAIGASGPFSYVGNAHNQQIFGAGLNYAVGAATLGIDYTNTKFNDANGTNGTVIFTNYEAWGRYKLSAAWSVGAQYVYTHGSIGYNGAVPIYHQVGLTTSYALSKRTGLYAMGVWQKAAGGASNADIFDGSVASASSNNHQLAVRLGMYHQF